MENTTPFEGMFASTNAPFISQYQPSGSIGSVICKCYSSKQFSKLRAPMSNHFRIAVAAGILLSSSSLFAVTTTDDPSQYLSTPGSIFAGVALLNVSGVGSCSASLIASNFLLTAAHCVASASGPGALMATFALANGGAATYTIANFFTDGPLAPDLSNDIALVELTTSVVGITPYSLGVSTLGQTITLAGYGDSGQGTYTPGSYGTFLAGLNTLDGYWDGSTQTNSINGTVYTLPSAGNALAFDFDSASGNGSLGGGAVSGVAPQNEAMICYGDSGGPAFAGNAFAGGPLTIIGVNAFISLPNPVDTSGNNPQCTNNEAAAGYAGFGDIGGDTNVANHLEWINSTIAGSATSEPASWALIGAGLGGLTLLRRLRARLSR